MSKIPLFYNYTEDYDERSATAHVRRLLDIVACTTSFGPSEKKEDSGKNVLAVHDSKASKKSQRKRASPPPEKNSSASPPPASKDVDVDGDGEIGNLCPRLGSFYEFFSLSHLTPPLQCQLSSLSLSLFQLCYICSNLYRDIGRDEIDICIYRDVNIYSVYTP